MVFEARVVALSAPLIGRLSIPVHHSSAASLALGLWLRGYLGARLRPTALRRKCEGVFCALFRLFSTGLQA